MAKISFFILWICLLGLLGEGLARWLESNLNSFQRLTEERFEDPKVPGLPYVLAVKSEFKNPGWTLKTNSIGLRDFREPEDFLKPENSSCEKILVVGSSYSMGYGVLAKDSIPSILEVLANKKSDKCFRFINASLEAFPISAKVALFKYLLPIYKPTQVVLELTSHDLDDPRIVEERHLSLDPMHSANHEWLKYKWNVATRYLDLQNNSYSQTEYLQSKSAPPDPWDRSLLYKKLKQVLNIGQRRSPEQNGCTSSDCLDLEPEIQGIKLLPYSPIFLSPYFRARAESNLDQFVKIASEKNIPIQIWNIDSDMRTWWKPKDPNIRWFDWGDLLEQPFEKFRSMNHLRGDFHLNPKGNFKMAEKIIPYVLEQNLRPPENPKVAEYWQTQKQTHIDQSKVINSKIDFLHRRGAHQIVGGLDSSQFLNESHQKINLLLRNGTAKMAKIWGRMEPLDSETIQLTLRAGTKEFIKKFVVNKNEWSFELPYKSDSEFVDLELVCISRPCNKTQLLGASTD